MGFLGEWTNGSNQVPDILRTGDFDAGPVAAGIFDNNIAGWAGTFLFTNLGDPHHYQTHAIDKLNSPYDLTTGAHDLGSYDIVSIAQGVQDYTSSSIAVAYQTLANLCAVFHTHSDLASYQAIIDATKAQADAAFKTAYGLIGSRQALQRPEATSDNGRHASISCRDALCRRSTIVSGLSR